MAKKIEGFGAEYLVTAINNDAAAHNAVVGVVKHLQHVVNRMAVKAAKANADWHDDPEADDHAAFHAPADQQFPQAVRDEAVLDLVKYWVNEFSIQQGAAK